MRLYLVRHCEAVHPLQDPARPLSDRGREQARRLAAWMPRTVGVVDEILHSGVPRARETAELLAAAIHPLKGVRQAPGLCPDDAPRDIADLLRHLDGSRVVVTHLPLVARVAGLLIGARAATDPLTFHTGSCAALLGEVDAWTVDWLVHPDVLPPAPRAPVADAD